MLSIGTCCGEGRCLTTCSSWYCRPFGFGPQIGLQGGCPAKSRGVTGGAEIQGQKRGEGESVETSGPLEAACPIPAVTVAVHPFAMFVLYCSPLHQHHCAGRQVPLFSACYAWLLAHSKWASKYSYLVASWSLSSAWYAWFLAYSKWSSKYSYLIASW